MSESPSQRSESPPFTLARRSTGFPSQVRPAGRRAGPNFRRSESKKAQRASTFWASRFPTRKLRTCLGLYPEFDLERLIPLAEQSVRHKSRDHAASRTFLSPSSAPTRLAGATEGDHTQQEHPVPQAPLLEFCNPWSLRGLPMGDFPYVIGSDRGWPLGRRQFPGAVEFERRSPRSFLHKSVFSFTTAALLCPTSCRFMQQRPSPQCSRLPHQ